MQNRLSARWIPSFLATIITTSFVYAQQTVIPIETEQNALVLQTDGSKRLGISYFGTRLQQANEYALVTKESRQNDENSGISNSAYTPSGTWNLFEPAIRVTHADGNTSLELQYQSHQMQKVDDNVTLTTVVLKDPAYAVEVSLYYKTYRKENVVEQWSTIRNNEKGTITLNKYASANLYFVGQSFHLTHYHGSWAHEMNPETTELKAGILSLDSKLGTRANLFQPPSFMLSFDQKATEETGKVLLGTLGWSGNFKIDFETDTYNNLRVIAGINPHASEYPLTSGQELKTPSFIYTFSDHGKGEASRNMHRWARKYRILDGEGSRLTLLNNWEATYFDFDEQKLTGLFADGKKLGVDLFLLDDGWFANKYPRNGDNAGLGDWKENVKKLPHGLGYLVKEAQKAGVKFGIWVEPEMVNPKSELYEKHPDWVIKQPERPEHYFRNQLVLDLSNPKVQDFVYGILDELFTKNPDLAFIKWDCNAVIYNAHSEYLKNSKQADSKLYVDYVKGLYKVLERVRAKYPKVPMMLCSGGGGRVDYEALKYFTEFWPSDNTDPLERVFMQWEYSYFFPTIAHCNHVTDWGKQPLKYRTDVAMMGKLGYDIVVGKLDEKDFEFSKQSVETYKKISDLVWHGDLYRLANPRENEYASLQFVNENKSRSVWFTYMVSSRYGVGTGRPIVLKGLDPRKKYALKELNLYPGTKSSITPDAVYTGDFLMSVGFNPAANLKRTSVMIELTEVK
ncbi:alpha-galactosidase [Siphonobacter sp. SORGH_AS_0500]|uniref:alpha-galactosidase n=1 Tax=Siphonobacter sp. SORGH_AS_0500 TaxID=1864824 RepID=UPI000CB0E82F|nr:alpha-galactosidase [Siphonobacter sp. SORGH_AS_0500]PKK38564.1 alpha-galactosidase [Siphonobacter sp. SORGH_AS_0500]